MDPINPRPESIFLDWSIEVSITYGTKTISFMPQLWILGFTLWSFDMSDLKRNASIKFLNAVLLNSHPMCPRTRSSSCRGYLALLVFHNQFGS